MKTWHVMLRNRIADVLGDCYTTYGVDDYNLMAAAVIRELEADYVLVPKSHTLAQQAPVLCKCGCGYVIREGVDN